LGPFLQALESISRELAVLRLAAILLVVFLSFFEFLKWALCPFFMYRDVLYAAAAWMQKSGELQDGRKLLLHFLHFHHPWRSFASDVERAKAAI